LAVKQNVQPVKPRHKVSIYIGAWVLGDYVGEALEPHIDKKVDEYVDTYKKARAYLDKLANQT
jgi:hypothetical protein